MKKRCALFLCSCILLTACTNTVQENIGTSAIRSATSLAFSEEFTCDVNDTELETNVKSENVSDFIKYGNVKRLLSEFAVDSRRIGEPGRDYAAGFISEHLKSNGWNVSLSEFPVYRYKDIFSKPYDLSGDGSESVGTGVNIIAELPGYDNSKPTLILSAHYDTTRDNLGIIDNGSGTAFLLSAAEWLCKADTDYNIRLIFFDVVESMMYGSKYYLENLSAEERGSLIADINFDTIGGNTDAIRIATATGTESALSIYLDQLTGRKYLLSDKGMSSDSNPFMYWKIPAVTFIDESLTIEPNEDSTYLDRLFDEAFDFLTSELATIISGFNNDVFRTVRNGNLVTDYTVDSLENLTDIYKRMAALDIIGFTVDRIYSAVYEDGISSRFCCDYVSDDGKRFTIESLSEINDESFAPLDGIPTFDDCKAAAKGDEKLVSRYGCYRITGNITDDELKAVWTQME